MQLSSLNAFWQNDTRLEAAFSMPGLHCEIRHCMWSPTTAARQYLDAHVLWMSLTPLPPRSALHSDVTGSQTLPAGAVNLMPAHAMIEVSTDGGRHRLLVCVIDPRHIERLVGHRWQGGLRAMSIGMDLRDRHIVDTLLRLVRELEAPGPASETLLTALGTSLMVDVARFLSGAVEVPRRGGLAPWQLRRIGERLEADPTPTLAELATLCGISVRHLIRAYKASTGETVSRQVSARQIAKAQRLLADTELPLKFIAAQLGFRHAASFSVAFRRAARETPRDYRQRMRGLGPKEQPARG